jgi:hypothetical protein
LKFDRVIQEVQTKPSKVSIDVCDYLDKELQRGFKPKKDDSDE